jgi:uncharacterized repeat protein (TIGR01451 family)
MKRVLGALLPLTLFVAMTTAAIGTPAAQAVTVSACGANTFAGNDDQSVGPVAMGFNLQFFNVTTGSVFVNNNGNLTFTSANGAFTPGQIAGASQPIIAPFWADVDTRPLGSAKVTYGSTTVGGHQAFCATWGGVGYFSQKTDKLNTFQVILVDRSDVGTGDFDIIFNYEQIKWESGDVESPTDDGFGGASARAGYSDGGSNSLEFSGSGINGGFLDSNPTTGLAHASNDGTPGQFLYQVRNGTPTTDAPAITSADNTTFTEGSGGTFTVTTTGIPTPELSEDGALPSGVTFVDNGDGTATLAGAPDPGTAGSYPITITASNETPPDGTQNFTLTVDGGPYSSISGTVWNDLNGNGQADTGGGGSLAAMAPVPQTPDETGEEGVNVTLCTSSDNTCTSDGSTTQTNVNGDYVFANLVPDTYKVCVLVPAGWHNTGANQCYEITLGADENNNGNDFFIQQDQESSPTLAIDKTGPESVQEQNPIGYTIDVSNTGSGVANDVVLTDSIPAGTTFNQATTTQGSCSFASGTLTCNLGTVGTDDAPEVTLNVQGPNVTADTNITNTASVSGSNADAASDSASTTVLVNNGGETQGDVPPDSQVPLTFTTGTSSSGGQTNVTAGDKTAVSIIVPAGGPGGTVTLEELPCQVAPCTGAAAAKDVSAQAVQPSAGKLVLGGVVYNVVPPSNYPNSKPFRVTMLWDKTLNPTQSPVWYFKPGVTPTEIKLPHCGTTSPNGGKPCVLQNAKITTGGPAIKGDWRVVVRINSDPRMRK